MAGRFVYICDWLPPDFGAVGQYAVMFAQQWAREGWAVTLVGLSSKESRREDVGPMGAGSLEIIPNPPTGIQKTKVRGAAHLDCYV